MTTQTLDALQRSIMTALVDSDKPWTLDDVNEVFGRRPPVTAALVKLIDFGLLSETAGHVSPTRDALGRSYW